MRPKASLVGSSPSLFRPAKGRRPGWGLGLACLTLFLVACQPRLAAKNPFEPPPVEYQRRLRLVFENQNYHPLAGAPVRVEFLSGQPLRPLAAHTEADGGLPLVAKPLMILGGGSRKNGDLFINYELRLRITLYPGSSREITFDLNDRESYAYYQDPLYEGQNRRPRETEEIINFTTGF